MCMCICLRVRSCVSAFVCVCVCTLARVGVYMTIIEIADKMCVGVHLCDCVSASWLCKCMCSSAYVRSYL